VCVLLLLLCVDPQISFNFFIGSVCVCVCCCCCVWTHKFPSTFPWECV
jgi:hypothetical protein